jgi:acyl-CoA thioesterase
VTDLASGPPDPAGPDLDTLTRPAGPRGALTADIPDGWQQGRGTFGGLVLALLTRAAETAIDDPERTLRSLAGEIVGPVQPGPAALAVEVLRAGTNVTTVAARLRQGDEVLAHAVGAFGKDRGTFTAAPTLPPPSPPPWRSLAVAPIVPPTAPVFARHVEFRLAGALPFSGAPVSAETGGWVRFRRPGRARDAAWLVAMIDTWWPAMLPAETAPRPVATLTFAFARIGDAAGLDPDAPLYYRARVLAGAGGYAVEARELWGEDGRLLALNQQTIVVVK